MFTNNFQIVAHALKNMGPLVQNYVSILPSEAGDHVLAVANNVRSHIKSLITYIKAYSSGQRPPTEGLKQATREFVTGTHMLYLTAHRVSQVRNDPNFPNFRNFIL